MTRSTTHSSLLRRVDTALDRRFEGTDLGLSMVKGLIDLHDGKIHDHYRQCTRSGYHRGGNLPSE